VWIWSKITQDNRVGNRPALLDWSKRPEHLGISFRLDDRELLVSG
jgi:hypothetical protein